MSGIDRSYDLQRPIADPASRFPYERDESHEHLSRHRSASQGISNVTDEG